MNDSTKNAPSARPVWDPKLAAEVLELLRQRQETLVVAESCTGGFLANEITNIPGASDCFLAGFVTYSNDSKIRALGVSAETLQQFGAVSSPTAKEMAEGARSKSGATYAIAITGIAGPGGGTEAKPVGTVFIALAAPEETLVHEKINVAERKTFKCVTAMQSLAMLRSRLERPPKSSATDS